MRTSRIRLWRALALLLATAATAALLVTAPAPPASAAPRPIDIRFRQGQDVGGSDSNETLFAEAFCLSDELVVSAGAIDTSGRVTALFPTENFTSVRAQGTNTGGNQTLFVIAGCAPRSLFSDVAFTRAQLGGTSTAVRTAIAPCPAGTVPFAGGGFYQATNGALVPASTMVQNAPATREPGWAFSGRPARASDVLHVRAMCARINGGVVRVQHGTRPGQVDNVTKMCTDEGLSTLAGGAYIQRLSDGGEGVGNITTSWPSGTSGWIAGGTPASGSRVVAFAVCAQPIPGIAPGAGPSARLARSALSVSERWPGGHPAFGEGRPWRVGSADRKRRKWSVALTDDRRVGLVVGWVHGNREVAASGCGGGAARGARRLR